MISAAFAYGNVQIVAIAGAETRNPRKSIPAALKATFTRVVMFYVLSIFVISLLIPADDPRLTLGNETVTQSPFVIAFSRAGIKVSLWSSVISTPRAFCFLQGIPSLFNAVVCKVLTPQFHSTLHLLTLVKDFDICVELS